MRYLAEAVGRLPDGRSMRVNGISAGPIKTLAASGIKDFGKLLAIVAAGAPLRRNVTIESAGVTSGPTMRGAAARAPRTARASSPRPCPVRGSSPSTGTPSTVLGEVGRVDHHAARGGDVHHRQAHHHRLPGTGHLPDEVERARQRGGVHQRDDEVDVPVARAGDGVGRHLLVGRASQQQQYGTGTQGIALPAPSGRLPPVSALAPLARASSTCLAVTATWDSSIMAPKS